MGNADDKPIILLLLLLLFRALKSHALSVNLTHFDAISCSHALTPTRAFLTHWHCSGG